MKFEKIANGKIFSFFDVAYKLIVLNIITALTIVLGLGIFSLMPALVALIIMIKSIKTRDEIPVVTTYFYAFFKNYKKAILTSISYILLIVLYLFNAYYFYEMVREYDGVYYGIAYYFCLIIAIVTSLAFINACFVMVYFPHLSIIKTIKYSFVLLKAIAWKALLMFVVLILFTYFAIWVLFLLPIILISLYCYIYDILVSHDYTILLPEGYESINATKYYEIIRSNKEKKKKK